MTGKSGADKSISHWNNIKWKPDCVDVKAEPGDIVMKINKFWFLCQTRNGFNNLICFLPRNEHAKYAQAVKAMFEFCYRLATVYKIDCVRIRGCPKRYKFVERFFPDNTALVKNECKNGDWVRYVLIDDKVIERLDILRKTAL